jgi:hypothetical protein
MDPEVVGHSYITGDRTVVLTQINTKARMGLEKFDI